MISKLILIVLALAGLMFGGWAGFLAFTDTEELVSTLGLMGMMGYLFHSTVIFASLTFPVDVRRNLTLLLLVWHVPETLLIATFGMGIPQEDQLSGIVIHSSFSLLALLSWYLAKDEGGTSVA